jgi:hypothetical protein
VLQQFRSNVAFHSRADVAAQIKARQALREDDTFLDLESARVDFQRLMTELIADELHAIPELPGKLAEFGVSHHPDFANVASASQAASSCFGPAFYSCEVLGKPAEEPGRADRGAGRLVAVLALLAAIFLLTFLFRGLAR